MIRAFQAAGLGSELEKKVFKATYDDQDQPKIKHVKALVEACGGSGVNTNVDIIVDNLYKRFQASKWNEILKTLVVIHTLTSVHGVPSERMLKIISDRKAFNGTDVLGAYVDDRSPESKGQSRYIQSYASYLVEKITTYRIIGYSHERAYPKDDNKWVSSLSLEVIFKALPRLQTQLESGMLEPYQWNGKVHPIGARATELILKDAFRLYSGINLMMVAILERHGALTLAQAETALECGKKDGALHEKFIQWSGALQELGFLKDKDKDKDKEKAKTDEDTLDEGEIPSSPVFGQSVSESFISVMEFLVKSLKKKASGTLKTSTPLTKTSRQRAASAAPAKASSSSDIFKIPKAKRTDSKTSSPKEETKGSSPTGEKSKEKGSPEVIVTQEWDPFSDFQSPSTSTTSPQPQLSVPTTLRAQRSASAAPAPRSAPNTVTKSRPSSVRHNPLPTTIPESGSEDFDPWSDLSSPATTAFTSAPVSVTTTPPAEPPNRSKRSGSVDHFTSLLSVNTSLSTPMKSAPNTFGGRIRTGSAAPALSLHSGPDPGQQPGLAQTEVLAIQAQLEALQAAQAALAARLGQLSVNLQPVLPTTPRMGTPSSTPDAFGVGGGGITTPVPFTVPSYQGVTTPVPFPPASTSSSSSSTAFDDPFADFA